MNYELAEGFDIWRAVAVHYAKSSEPWALYIPDNKVWRYHAAALITNFQPRTYTRTLHNPFSEPFNPGGHRWFLPNESLLERFPRSVDHDYIARVLCINYNNPNDPNGTNCSAPPTPQYPDWVLFYISWLELQIRQLGEIEMRSVAPFPF